MLNWLWEPLRAYWARKRLERLQSEAAAKLFREATSPERVAEDPDVADWRPIGFAGKELDDPDRDSLRDKARDLADHNPYARSILSHYRNYVVGTGMRHEVALANGRREPAGTASSRTLEHVPGGLRPPFAERVAALWQSFLDANDWHTGHRKDWEFCLRTWRDGECFLRLFRQATWPPRVHFIDPEHVAADPRTGLPTAGIETEPGNVEEPLAYFVASANGRREPAGSGYSPSLGHVPGGLRPPFAEDVERIPADRVLHTKIGVDANVKRGLSIFVPVMDALKRFHGWLDVELIQRKVASSIVLVRKHTQNYPGGVSSFADSAATKAAGSNPVTDPRRVRIQPGSIIDAQGFDLQFLSPNTHFEDASLLGRMILLSIAAGTGLPEFMLTADASNANYASTLVAQGPAVRHFAAWQAFFAGQWQKLFRMVLNEAVWLGHVSAAEADQVTLHITPPPLAVRNRRDEAEADALYYDRGALSAKELARRDGADPERMRAERMEETGERPA